MLCVVERKGFYCSLFSVSDRTRSATDVAKLLQGLETKEVVSFSVGNDLFFCLWRALGIFCPSYARHALGWGNPAHLGTPRSFASNLSLCQQWHFEFSTTLFAAKVFYHNNRIFNLIIRIVQSHSVQVSNLLQRLMKRSSGTCAVSQFAWTLGNRGNVLGW